jgi:acyl-coenzyme A thioesterase PaaI-like protein
MQTLALYQNVKRLPAGNWLFSRIVSIKAPYFGSVSPYLESMKPGRAVATIKDKRKHHNHIGTVHAIAVCNLCEFTMGMLAEATIYPELRWLPKGLNIRYLIKAEGPLRAIAEMSVTEFNRSGEIQVPVKVFNQRNELVADATIPLHITPRKGKK